MGVVVVVVVVVVVITSNLFFPSGLTSCGRNRLLLAEIQHWSSVKHIKKTMQYVLKC